MLATPCPDLDAAGDRAHQLGGRQPVIVGFDIEDRLEAGVFGFAGDGLDVAGAPPRAGQDRKAEPFCHGPFPLVKSALMMIAPFSGQHQKLGDLGA